MNEDDIYRNHIFLKIVISFYQLPDLGNRPELVEKELNESLKRLQLSYVDLYLIHVPFAFKASKEKDADGNWVLDTTTDHIAIWKVNTI